MVEKSEKESTLAENLLNAFKAYKEAIKNNEQEIGNQAQQPVLEYNVLFISLDIVNSSSYKASNKIYWLPVLTKLFKEIQKQIGTAISQVELWRVIGDEIVFIVKVKDVEMLSTYVEKVFVILSSINISIADGKFFKEYAIESEKAMHGGDTIALQGTVWLAPVTDETKFEKLDDTEHCGNVCIKYKNDTPDELVTSDVYEFMGNDIDAGFRIKQFTQKGRLAVSFELAYILSERTRDDAFLHIIAYRKLKGIWENKLYPITWYHNDLTSGEKQFKDSFSFDEADDNELVKEYFLNIQGKNEIIDISMFQNTHMALETIAKERKLLERLEFIKEKMATNDRKIIDPSSGLVLHLSAICYEPKTKKILIMKRADNVSANAGLWEFGHVIANSNCSNEECLRRNYKEKYNVDIEVIMEKGRLDKQPIPLYLYQSEDGIHKKRGITTLARVQKCVEIKKKNEYTEARWVDRKEIKEILPEKAVRDFHDSASRAFQMIEIIEKKRGL